MGKPIKAKTVRVDDHGDKPELATPIESGVSQMGYFYHYLDLDYFKFIPATSQEYTVDGEALGNNSYALNKVWEFMIWENGTYIKKFQQKNFSYSFEAGKTYYILPKLLRYFHIDEEAYETNYVLNVFPKDSEKPKNITGITLNKNQMEMDEGTTETLQAAITPADTTDSKDIEWSSSDESVATVTNGEVTGTSEGTATITAKTSNGLTAVCEVTVNKVIIPVERIELTTDYKEVYVGKDQRVNIKATFYPDNATDKTLTWHSSDESIATVSETGVVEALKVGGVTITATSGTASAEIDFDAVDHVETIQIERTLDRNEVFEEEFQMPAGETWKGWNRIIAECRTDNGTFYCGNIWLTISENVRPDVHYHGDPPNLHLLTYAFPNSILKIRMVNDSPYYRCNVKLVMKVYPLRDRNPRPISTQSLLEKLPVIEENVLGNDVVAP